MLSSPTDQQPLSRTVSTLQHTNSGSSLRTTPLSTAASHVAVAGHTDTGLNLSTVHRILSASLAPGPLSSGLNSPMPGSSEAVAGQAESLDGWAGGSNSGDGRQYSRAATGGSSSFWRAAGHRTPPRRVSELMLQAGSGPLHTSKGTSGHQAGASSGPLLATPRAADISPRHSQTTAGEPGPYLMRSHHHHSHSSTQQGAGGKLSEQEPEEQIEQGGEQQGAGQEQEAPLGSVCSVKEWALLRQPRSTSGPQETDTSGTSSPMMRSAASLAGTTTSGSVCSRLQLIGSPPPPAHLARGPGSGVSHSPGAIQMLSRQSSPPRRMASHMPPVCSVGLDEVCV